MSNKSDPKTPTPIETAPVIKDPTEKKPVKKDHTLSMGENFLLSGAAAIISKTAAAPIERVKLLVQNQSEMIKAKTLSSPYKGLSDCFSRTLKNEGVLSFWRGNSANVLRYFPTQALNFAFKDRIKKSFNMRKTDSTVTKLCKNVLSGGFAGSISLAFVYSLDYSRTRLANDTKNAKKGGERQFNGLVDVMKKTMKSDGMKGLYRGFGISVVGIFIYRGMYFGLYDTAKPLLMTGKENLMANFLLGYIVTITAGLISYPIDTVRRRMMMTSGTGVVYKSSLHCAKTVVTKEGFGTLFKGAGANIMRGLAGAAVLALFDEFKKSYIGFKHGRQ